MRGHVYERVCRRGCVPVEAPPLAVAAAASVPIVPSWPPYSRALQELVDPYPYYLPHPQPLNQNLSQCGREGGKRRGGRRSGVEILGVGLGVVEGEECDDEKMMMMIRRRRCNHADESD